MTNKKFISVFRYDTRPAPKGYVTPEEASDNLNGRGSGAESARERMLARMKLKQKEDNSSTAAREDMIQRHRGKKQ